MLLRGRGGGRGRGEEVVVGERCEANLNELKGRAHGSSKMGSYLF